MIVLGKKITVKYLSEASSDDPYMGRSDVKRNEITICKDMPIDNQEETLLHEVIHNILDNLGVKQRENLIQQLSVSLYSVFKDNNINWRLLK